MCAEVLNGCDHLSNPIANIMIGAMTPHNALKYVRDKTLVIVPGDRDDIVLAVVSMSLLREDMSLAGIVLTGAVKPQPQTMDLVYRTQIPVLAVTEQTYETASRIHDTAVKTHVSEDEKIQLAASLVCEHVDLESLWAALD